MPIEILLTGIRSILPDSSSPEVSCRVQTDRCYACHASRDPTSTRTIWRETVVFFLVENRIFGDGNLRAKMVRVTYRLKSIVAVAYLVSSAYPARSAQTTNKEYFTAGNSCNDVAHLAVCVARHTDPHLLQLDPLHLLLRPEPGPPRLPHNDDHCRLRAGLHDVVLDVPHLLP